MKNSSDMNENKYKSLETASGEERYQSILEDLPGLICHFLPGGDITFVNDTFCQYFGKNPQKLLGESFFSLIYDEDREFVMKNITSFTSEKPLQSYEFRVKIPDGKIHWLHWTNRALFDENGNIYTCQSLGKDITWYKQMEKSLDYARSFSENLIHSASAIIVGLDTFGNVTFMNPKAEEITGYNQFEIMGKNWFELIVPMERYPEVHVEFKRLLEGGLQKTFQNYIQTKNGNERFISWSNNEVVQDGEIVGIISFGIDITEQKQAEEELRISEEKFRKIFHKSPASIAITNLKTGEFIDVNETFERDFGYTRKEVIGKSSLNIGIWKNPDDRKRIMTNYLKNRYANEKELEFVRKSGETMIADASFCMINILAQDFSIAIANDLTNRKIMEQKIQEYQQNLKSLVSQLTIAEEKERSTIASDLHDNVGQFLALARIQLAKLRKLISEERELGILDNISGTLLTSIRNIRNLVFNLSSPSLNEIGLSSALFEWMEEHLVKRQNIRIKFIDSGKTEKLSDGIRTILFRNTRELLTNVIKHSHAENVSVCLKETIDSIKIIVSDDGVGFDPDSVSQGQKNRTSFGLFSVRERMMYIGGSMDITSEPGKGSKIVLTAPLSTENNKEMM